MTMPAWGALLGAMAAVGVWLVVARIKAIRRPVLADRVFPFVRDLPRAGLTRSAPEVAIGALPGLNQAAAGVFGPVLGSVGSVTGRILGGAASVERRLTRAGLARTVSDFRVEQVLWGIVGFVSVASLGLLWSSGDPSGAVGWLVASGTAFVGGVLLRDNHLTSQVRARERTVEMELPVIAELLALAVAAGEGPVGALERVVRRTGGEFSRDLATVLAAIQTGTPVGQAFDRLAADTGLPAVARFAQGIAVAVERGTPLADVLHAQAADVREATRRALIESAARREVAMMIPVVFLVLPITIVFAFWPGYVGLSLVAP
ncbi:MAG: type II secretion system F family protein [Nocardioides sp.]